MQAAKLLKYLTLRNLQYLSVIFRIILDSANPAHHALWKRFDEILPEGSSREAQARLRELSAILEEYRKERKRNG